jgi:RNA polymerase sigma factor (sigma-70 family)
MKGQRHRSIPTIPYGKEASRMELTASQKRIIQLQYHKLAMKIMKDEAKDCYREYTNKMQREALFSELTAYERNQLQATDSYPSDFIHFSVLGYDIAVHDAQIGEALAALPVRKRNIILMSYFLDMSDAEIGELMHLVRQTIYRHRTSTLSNLAKYIKEVQANEKNE